MTFQSIAFLPLSRYSFPAISPLPTPCGNSFFPLRALGQIDAWKVTFPGQAVSMGVCFLPSCKQVGFWVLFLFVSCGFIYFPSGSIYILLLCNLRSHSLIWVPCLVGSVLPPEADCQELSTNEHCCRSVAEKMKDFRWDTFKSHTGLEG